MRCVAFLILSSVLLPAQSRPPITGVGNVAFYVSELDKAEAFYGHALGFAHFRIDEPAAGPSDYYKVNDHQYIEIYAGLKGDEMDRLAHVAFETSDVKKLRRYLGSKGIKVPARLNPATDGSLSFMVDDPEGRHIEFVQYVKGSQQQSKFGTLLPATRISDHIIHAGFIVHDRAAEDKFYHDILGFELMWYGGMKENEVKWVDMRVPDGTDWIEYMLGANNPTPRTRGVLNHFALGVTDIHAANKTIVSHDFAPREQPKIGRDGKWQLNLYDVDLTRVELMELKPVQTPCCSEMKMK